MSEEVKTAEEAAPETREQNENTAPVQEENTQGEGNATATEDPAPKDGGETKKPEEAAKPAPAKTLLEDDEPKAENEAPQVDAQEAEKVDAFVKGIEATDLGDGVTWSDDALKAMAPSLMEVTGGDPKKANGVVKAYATYVQNQAKKEQEAAEAFNASLIAECQKRFGDDLKKVAKFAREGGKAIFGETLWNELKATPAFANNPDILERLAQHGKRIAEDNGAIKPKDGTPSQSSEDVLHRMYGTITVG